MIEVVFQSNLLNKPPQECTGCVCDSEREEPFKLTLGNSVSYDDCSLT